jgi:hypothetical protein
MSTALLTKTLSFISPNLIIWFVGMYNIFTNAIGLFQKNATDIKTIISQLLGPKEYLFFYEYNVPCLRSTVNVEASGSAKVEWIYDADKRVFYQYDYANKYREHPSRLPVLSIEVIENNKVLYDLTDFLDTLRFVSCGDSAPSIEQLIGAWSLSSGIILDTTRNFELRFLCTEANMHVTHLRNTSSVHDIIRKAKGENEEEATEDTSEESEEIVVDEECLEENIAADAVAIEEVNSIERECVEKEE